MKKIGVLNKDISTVIAGMGHTDMLVIGDAGLPIPKLTQRIDLAIANGVPSFMTTVEAISVELRVEKIIIAVETKEQNPQIYQALIALFQDARVEFVEHEELKKLCGNAIAVVRTGECTPFANVILVSGVNF